MKQERTEGLPGPGPGWAWLAGALALTLACSVDGSQGPASATTSAAGGLTSTSGGTLTLSGTLPTSTSASGASAAATALDPVRPGASEVSAASTVLAFAADGTTWTAPVVGGAFSVAVDPGSAVGVVFAGSAGQFLGYLAPGDGISSLPLTDVASGVTRIDLGSLTAMGPVLTPANPPLGTALPLTVAEQRVYAQFSGLFAGVVQNPDVDGNGVIDLLEGKYYHPYLTCWVGGGSFHGALRPTVDGTIAIQAFNLTLVANGTSDAASATVTGPAGSGIAGQACTITTASADNTTSYSLYPDPGSSLSAVPVAGSYVFSTGGGATLAITVPDQSDASSAIVIAVPTVALNADNTINSISWVCQTRSGAPIATPSALIRSFDLEIDHPIGTAVYSASNLAASASSQTLAGVGVPWDSTVGIHLAYTDLFQNRYVIAFTND
jgi:hypothetical protein